MIDRKNKLNNDDDDDRDDNERDSYAIKLHFTDDEKNK